ncbi:hypothetical protein PALU110988_25060 [Paenibacillus lupini]|uniref:hypothetical protein n=1 Tax=Paenibacillus lupini TaxID=1450204 RepID=UPI0014212F19|nr:hypothetical protein [Paenibacillus lupini]NIK21760.1 hypothetical protein [Paenibacillus lupini]
MRLTICLFIILLVISGCTNESNQTVTNNKPGTSEENKVTEDTTKVKENKITLTPVDVFSGDAAIFKPFLGTMSGAFKLSYEGSEPNVWLDLDVWENGKKVATKGSIGQLLYSSEENPSSGEVEVIMSVDTVPIEGNDEIRLIKVNVVHDKGNSSLATTTIPWDSKLTLQGLLQHNEKKSFTAVETVYAFGVQASSANSMSTAELTSESLSKTEWALVFTLRYQND